MFKIKQKTEIPFWLITISIVLVFTLSYLIQDAMFQDAMLYSSVSHNLGIGIGTFWFPQYSTLNIAGLSSFHEHPPLVFGIQSIFYRMFGDSIYIERFYTLAMIILTMILINWLWKITIKNKPELSKFGWLPVLYWILVPIVQWNYRYNMLENTMGIFILLSFITSYYNLKYGSNKLLFWILSGFFVFLASFSKGIPGLFIIVVPFVYWLTTKRISFKQSALFTTILIGVPIVIYATLLLFPDSRDNLTTYFFKRVLWRIDSLPTAEYRLEIIVRVIMELLPVIIGTLIAYVFGKIKKIEMSENFKEASFFILTGFAGALPLTLTLCQRGWYLVPIFPYFAIGFALLTIPTLSLYVNTINIKTNGYKTFFIASCIVFVTAMTFTGTKYGKIGRDQDIVTDVYEIGKVVPKYSTITVPKEMYNQYDFVLQGFLVRYFNISISPYQEYDYFLTEKKLKIKPLNYEKVDITLNKYELYKKNAHNIQ